MIGYFCGVGIGIVRVASGYSGQAKEVLRKESKIYAHEYNDEVGFGIGLVQCIA